MDGMCVAYICMHEHALKKSSKVVNKRFVCTLQNNHKLVYFIPQIMPNTFFSQPFNELHCQRCPFPFEESALFAFQSEILSIFATPAKSFTQMNWCNGTLAYNKSLSHNSHTGGDLPLIFQ